MTTQPDSCITSALLASPSGLVASSGLKVDTDLAGLDNLAIDPVTNALYGQRRRIFSAFKKSSTAGNYSISDTNRWTTSSISLSSGLIDILGTIVSTEGYDFQHPELSLPALPSGALVKTTFRAQGICSIGAGKTCSLYLQASWDSAHTTRYTLDAADVAQYDGRFSLSGEFWLAPASITPNTIRLHLQAQGDASAGSLLEVNRCYIQAEW